VLSLELDAWWDDLLVAIYLGGLKDLATLARTIGEIWHGK
jgi:hypothetical protein